MDTLNINLRVIKKNYRPGATNTMTDELQELIAKRARKEKLDKPEKKVIEAKYKMNDTAYKVKYSLWPQQLVFKHEKCGEFRRKD